MSVDERRTAHVRVINNSNSITDQSLNPRGDFMQNGYKTLWCGLVIALASEQFVGCSGSDDSELTRVKADAAAARVELEKVRADALKMAQDDAKAARAELERLKRKSTPQPVSKKTSPPSNLKPNTATRGTPRQTPKSTSFSDNKTDFNLICGTWTNANGNGFTITYKSDGTSKSTYTPRGTWSIKNGKLSTGGYSITGDGSRVTIVSSYNVTATKLTLTRVVNSKTYINVYHRKQ